jgi:hypothetical protein
MKLSRYEAYRLIEITLKLLISFCLFAESLSFLSHKHYQFLSISFIILNTCSSHHCLSFFLWLPALICVLKQNSNSQISLPVSWVKTEELKWVSIVYTEFINNNWPEQWLQTHFHTALQFHILNLKLLNKKSSLIKFLLKNTTEWMLRIFVFKKIVEWIEISHDHVILSHSDLSALFSWVNLI